MSNLYVTEPATNGKVIIETTVGEVEVELWGKEAPQAVRNFLALSIEGYYDGVIFHRVVPGFIVQTGDPTGTGTGGESFYGEPFQDEIHGRLKFNRRGLMGMANNSKRHTNGSQFFFTMDRADELTGKHTLFGKVAGNTIFNILNIGNVDVDAEERPLHPPKIRTIRIVENPFDDIVPRITAAERRAQQQARLDAKRQADARERKSKAKKNTALLSFGDSEEIPAAEVSVRKGGMSRLDLVESSEPVPTKAPHYTELPPSLQDLADGTRQSKKTVNLRDIRAQHEREKHGASEARQEEIKRMQENLRKLKKRAGDASASDSESDDGRKRRRGGKSYLEEELSKYRTGRGRAALRSDNRKGKRDEEDDLLKEMGRFSKKVALAEGEGERPVEGGDSPQTGEMEEGLEVDDDVGWLTHSLKFVADEKEMTRRAEEEYAVIDPRAKARQLADEQKRGKDSQQRRTAGGAGRRR